MASDLSESLDKLSKSEVVKMSRDEILLQIKAAQPEVIECLRTLAQPILSPEHSEAAAKQAFDIYKQFNEDVPSGDDAVAILLKLGDPQVMEIVRKRFSNYNQEPALWEGVLRIGVADKKTQKADIFWDGVTRSGQLELLKVYRGIIEQSNLNEESYTAEYSYLDGRKVTGFAQSIGTTLKVLRLLVQARGISDAVRDSARALLKPMSPDIYNRERLRNLLGLMKEFYQVNRRQIDEGNFEALTPLGSLKGKL